MSFAIILISLAVLVLLISYFRVDAFLAFIIVSLGAGIALGIPLAEIPAVVDRGIGNILGSLTLVLVLGAMLGKLVAESGAAQKIADVMIGLFGVKNIRWGLMVTGLIVGIPLFYNVGFVLMVPIIFSISYQYKLPAVYIGLPMLAAMSVAHGYLPPHPSPVALVSIFGADMGMTLILGIIVAIPAILVAGPLYGSTLKKIKTGPLKLFEKQTIDSSFSNPGKANNFITAVLPVCLLIIVTVIPYLFPNIGEPASGIVSLISAPSVVMLVSLGIATFTLGINRGRSMAQVMKIYGAAAMDIVGILLIIAGSGIFREVMETSGVSLELADALAKLPIHPLVLGWMTAAIIRGCLGSATVAALTAATMIMPLMVQSGVNPNLMVLSLGAGSLMFSHFNDSGFWLFKEYFNASIKDTLRSWSVMEILVGVVGLAGVMVLNIFI